PRRPKLVRATSAPSSTPLVCQAPAPAPPAPSLPPVWKVPPGTLSNAGRLVVLRVPDGPSRASPQRSQGAGDTDDVRAEYTCDQELRTVVFGDPMMHIMKTYARRVEVLATKAVTAQIWG
ncbi:hypothetical protein MMC08_005330, partial [Hypocenomyce scalaris]|nr:hypothetical protein [Hypocenomyce scalaris]